MDDHFHTIDRNKFGGSGEKSVGIESLSDKIPTGLPLPHYGLDKVAPGKARETASDSNSARPLYNSRIIITYVEYLKKHYPQVDIDSVLQFAGMTRHEVEDPGHWFNQQQTDKFHDILVAQTGNRHIARDAGKFTISCNRLGPAKQYALGLINLASVYLMVGKLAKTMSRGARMTAKKLAANKVEIISRPRPGTAEKPYQCENRLGSLVRKGT